MCPLYVSVCVSVYVSSLCVLSVYLLCLCICLIMIVLDYSVSHPYGKVLDADIIQLLGNAGAAHHVDQLGLVEASLLQVGCCQVGCPYYVLLAGMTVL